ncbi:MAG: ATP-binding protein [Armatimonadota bacterium]|nr:HAMP domain-containing protein [bacterium]
MKITSIRTRLTLWNICVMALILLLLSVALRYSIQSYLMSAADHELVHRAHRTAGFAARNSKEFVEDFRKMAQIQRDMGHSAHFKRQPLRFSRAFNRAGQQTDPFGAILKTNEKPWDRKLFIQSLVGKTGFSTIKVDDELTRVYSQPLLRNGEISGVVQAAYPLTELMRFLGGFTVVLAVFFPFALLTAGLGGMFLTTRWLRPVREITHTAEEISARDLSRRLGISGDDEFAQLALTFNRMLERLQKAFQQLEQSVEQQKRFTADASHELRTPLTTIKANTSLALRQARSAEDYKEALAAADGAADVMDHLIRDLLLLARSDDGQLVTELEAVPVSDVLREAVTLVGWKDGRAEIRVEMENESLSVTGNAHHLTRLVMNLLDNALRHTPSDGLITLSAAANNGAIVLCVADNGEGIALEHLVHLGERFYRVDKCRDRKHGGTGLGLAICRSIAEAHHGSISIESTIGQGTVVTVTLPEPLKECVM